MIELLSALRFLSYVHVTLKLGIIQYARPHASSISHVNPFTNADAKPQCNALQPTDTLMLVMKQRVAPSQP
jgi:hypothetical protein